jgi:metallo-beta-lactamase class B
VATLLALLTSTAMAAQTGDSVPACPIDADPMQGWDTRAPAKKIFGNTYYVGTCGIASVLVTFKQGLILIDGATEKAGPLIAANIEALGFKLGDVKYILNTHEHSDHAGGIAYLQRVTGAQVLARTPAVTALEHGTSTSDDPQFGQLEKFPPVIKVQPLTDGQVLRMGELTLTAHATPGHAPGSTSWTWTSSCEGARCLNIAYADSLSSISDKGYRYIQHPAYVQAFRAGIDSVGALPCDILITPHPAASNLFARLAGKAPLIDAGACKRYAADARINLEKRLQGEKKATTP